MRARVENRAELPRLIEDAIAIAPVGDVLDRLRAAEVPCAPVLAVDGVVSDPHVAARGALRPTIDNTIGEILQTRMPIGDGAPASPAPSLGEHGREILVELGFEESVIQRMLDRGAMHEAG